MDNIVKTTITIGGGLKIDNNSFSYLSISCSMKSHHSLSLSLPLSNLKGVTLENLVDYLGSDISIQCKYENDKIPGLLTYKGVITSMYCSNDDSLDPSISINAADPSVLLDDHIRYESFLDMSLADIVKKVIRPYGHVKLDSKPTYSKKIAYSVLYNETSYSFLNRMAAKYGQWFYYDNENFIFGKKNTGSNIDLILGGNMRNYSFNLQSTPLKDNSKTYNYEKVEMFESQSQHDAISSLDTRFGEKLKKKSLELFPNLGTNFHSPKYDEKDDLIDRDRILKEQLASELFTFSGNSNELGICLGSIVNIYSSVKLSDGSNEKNKEGSFLVTSISHSINNDGTYYNSFLGIPDKNTFPLIMMSGDNFSAKLQVAKVIDNKDPKNLGRVKVRFSWMGQEEKTPWIRVNHVHASKNRGFYFIPEIGDEVLVDFESNDPDCPIVLGAVYNGANKPDEWYHDNNEIKAIRTKSGNEIIFNDKSGEETIEIANPSGRNRIVITISENNQIKILSDGDIELKAKNKISMKSKEIEMTADNELSIKSQKMTAKANQTKITSDTSMDIEGGTETVIKGGVNLNMEGGTEAVLKGATVRIN